MIYGDINQRLIWINKIFNLLDSQNKLDTKQDIYYASVSEMLAGVQALGITMLIEDSRKVSKEYFDEKHGRILAAVDRLKN